MRYVRMYVLAGLLITNVWAQTSGTSPDLATRDVRITAADSAGRSFPDGTVIISMTQTEGVSDALNVGGVEFVPGIEKRYPVRDGVATAQLIVSSDAGPSLEYSLKLKDGSGQQCATRTLETSLSMREVPLVSRNCKASPSHQEIYGAGFFGAASIGLIVATFFYWSFKRMLFGRRMEVGDATMWSTVVTLFYLVVASGTVAVAYFSPTLLSSAAQTTYVGLVVIFVGIYLLGTLSLFLITQSRAAGGAA